MRFALAATGSAILLLPLFPGSAGARDELLPALTRTVRYKDYNQDVQILQEHLRRWGYSPGPVNGYYGEETRSAVWTFQKVNGLRPTTRVDERTRDALFAPVRVRPLVKGAPGRRIEIDLRRRLLVVWKRHRPVLVTHVSTGADTSYCDRGVCGFARTPVGNFRVTRRIKGWHTGLLGSMYYPAFFHGGVALHGSLSVPLRKASHGCVRIPMHVARKVYRHAKIGMPVYVRKPAAPVPWAKKAAKKGPKAGAKVSGRAAAGR
jgi:hypothetical protein